MKTTRSGINQCCSVISRTGPLVPVLYHTVIVAGLHESATPPSTFAQVLQQSVGRAYTELGSIKYFTTQ